MIARKVESDKCLFLGLDLGTSAVKVGLFDTEGHLLCRARRAYPLYTPRPGWAEQEPEEWWAATCETLRETLAEVDAGRVAAVGLSGQAPSQVLVAADGTPLGRAIVWSDRRAAAEADWLAERITPEQAQAWTGCTFVTGVSQPPARLLWLKAHRPDDWARCAAIVQPKDFIALRLTGRATTDINSAFCLFNPLPPPSVGEASSPPKLGGTGGGQYAAEFLALLGVGLEKMPPVLDPTGLVGHVTPDAAAATGLRPGIPVVTGTVDAWCEIIGCGGNCAGLRCGRDGHFGGGGAGY